MSNRYRFFPALAFGLIIITAAPFSGRAQGSGNPVEVGTLAGLDPARTSVFIADAMTGREMAGHLPDLTLNPASCAKIVTSAAALAILGPDYHFTTDFFADSQMQGGTIGTLYVKGTGDPMLVNEELSRIANDLYSRGLRRITGGIAIDDSYFDSYEFPNKGGRASAAYTAKTAATAVNFNSVEIEVGPGRRAGALASIETIPPNDYFQIVNKAVTSGKFNVNLSLKNGNGRETILASGRVPANFEPQKFYRSVYSPPLYAASVLRAFLRQVGIAVDGPLRTERVPAGATKIASEDSRPLSEIVKGMNKLSINFIAEQTLKHLGAVKFGAPGSTDKGIAVVEDYLASIGIPKGSYALENGSGLSGISRISSRQLVVVLSAAYKNTRTRDALVNSFSILGVDGTTKSWRFASDLQGRAYVKTGTVDGVSTLAGFVPTASGRMVAFAVLVNGLTRGVDAAHRAEIEVVRAIAEAGK